MDMDMQQIRYFVAAYEEGSFTKAAAREHCTQPGLSVHIQRLEAMLSHRLFDRHARGVTPTVAGRHFYACCTDVLGAVKAAGQRMLDLAGSVAGAINVGLPPTFCKTALPSMLPDYLSAHPYVEVRLAEAYSNTLSEWVASGDLDVAIVTEPSDYPGLENTRFFRDRMVLVTGPDHRTNGSTATSASKRKHEPGHWTPAELETLKLVLPSRRQNLRRAIESRIWHGATASGKILEIDGLTGTVEFVRSSDWATILPAFSVIEDVRAGQLAAEPISEPEPWLDYFLVQKKDLPLSLASRHFLDMLKAAIERISTDWPGVGASRWS